MGRRPHHAAGAATAALADPAHPTFRRDRSGPARQRQLPGLRRPEAAGSGLQRGGGAPAVAHPAPVVFPHRGLCRLPGLLRRGRRQGVRRRPGQWPGGCGLPGASLLDAGLAELGRWRPVAQHLHRLPRRRAGPAAVPRAVAPGGLRLGRHGVQRVVCHCGRAHRRRTLAVPGRRGGAPGLCRVRWSASVLPCAHARHARAAEFTLREPGAGRGCQAGAEGAHPAGLPPALRRAEAKLGRLHGLRCLGRAGQQRQLRRPGGLRPMGTGLRGTVRARRPRFRAVL
jgi:hypothetical protein